MIGNATSNKTPAENTKLFSGSHEIMHLTPEAMGIYTEAKPSAALTESSTDPPSVGSDFPGRPLLPSREKVICSFQNKWVNIPKTRVEKTPITGSK
jgi:hypothetical protein